jgi:hypothetical protein
MHRSCPDWVRLQRLRTIYEKSDRQTGLHLLYEEGFSSVVDPFLALNRFWRCVRNDLMESRLLI